MAFRILFGSTRDVVLEAKAMMALGLEDPRGQVTISLALALEGQSLALEGQSLALALGPWLWKLSLTLVLSFQIFNEPTQRLFPFQQVLGFHSETVMFSWMCGFMEASPTGSQFPSALSPAGKELLQSSRLGTGREGVHPLWTFYAPTSRQSGR